MEDITKVILNGMTKSFDDLFIEALSLKGYIFENINEAEIFVRENCLCTDDIGKKEKIFYVKGIPFLLWNYSFEIDYSNIHSENVKLTANFGKYAFL